MTSIARLLQETTITCCPTNLLDPTTPLHMHRHSKSNVILKSTTCSVERIYPLLPPANTPMYRPTIPSVFNNRIRPHPTFFRRRATICSRNVRGGDHPIIRRGTRYIAEDPIKRTYWKRHFGRGRAEDLQCLLPHDLFVHHPREHRG